MTQNASKLQIKEICKKRGISLKELADKIGIAPEALTRTVSSTANPTLLTLQKIAEGLNIDVKDLFTESKPSYRIYGHIEVNGELFTIRDLEGLKLLVDKCESEIND